MFYDEFIKMCGIKGVTKTKACTDCGMSRTAWNRWKNGAIPHGEALSRIAKYFDVSTDFLLGDGEKTEKEKILPGNPRSISDEDIKFALFNGDEDITDEMYDEVKAYAEFVKQKYQKGK